MVQNSSETFIFKHLVRRAFGPGPKSIFEAGSKQVDFLLQLLRKNVDLGLGAPLASFASISTLYSVEGHVDREREGSS